MRGEVEPKRHQQPAKKVREQDRHGPGRKWREGKIKRMGNETAGAEGRLGQWIHEAHHCRSRRVGSYEGRQNPGEKDEREGETREKS